MTPAKTRNRKLEAQLKAVAFGALTALAISTPAYARKTNQPVYQDPFDLGAGGASLTRASKDGRVFANPALLPYGGKFHYWGGSSFSILANKESIDTARDLFGQASGSSSGGGEESGAEGDDDTATAENSKLMDRALEHPVRVGWGSSLSWITSHFGLSVFSRLEMDLRAREFGETGFPEAHFQAESYHGVVLGTALRTPWRWLSVGAAAKMIYGSEPNLRVQLTDTDSISQMSDPSLRQDLSNHKTGIGGDLGVLMFFQGQHVDWSFAAKVDDIGDTKFSGGQVEENAADAAAAGGSHNDLESFKQVMSAGAGLTFHTGSDAFHLALDYRDMTNAYGEKSFKKVYAGAKLLLRTYVGVSAGYYQGYPTYGAEVDFIVLRLAGTYYTRELGESPGVDPRRIYMFTLSAGL